MWNNVKYFRSKGFNNRITIGNNVCTPKRFCFRRWVKRIFSYHSTCMLRPDLPHFGLKRERTGPPWKILFFGTDDFAVESLKKLSASRHGSSDRLVESLEVVTLDKELPVRKFANQNKLVVHDWPHIYPHGQFDVGVVVSFGCLLREGLIRQFPFGILNVHPSLLPRWRGPAPVFHTILHGDAVTGVTIMQIRPKRFDVGPILSQEVYQVPEHCTVDQLGATLATMGAHLLIDTLKTLPEKIASRREQAKEGATSAPKINTVMSWVDWEEQTCEQIGRLFRAIGSRIPLRTIWMGDTVKLLEFCGEFNESVSEDRALSAGSVQYQKESNTLLVRCKDGWVGFRAVVLRKRLSAADFYNGYLHPFFTKKLPLQHRECVFQSKQVKPKD
ncbi:methionyl-tRNA formyltransferase, mitochondrial isoform X1 [Megalops cyprinoides]|uniref:methionyl-tRNA formyltransferase, mitochondrial isoform X1 n=1 Tax=Megalops cyprinoides TaxID=118141 RepID=UPI001864F8F8|nr:methionyl-tRNA formyltransferase, mitochondrial isoform X1 [Megalops cyprinoides]